MKKNNYRVKLRRTLTSVLPVSKKRKGKCRNCGKCCQLPNTCIFLKYKSDGTSFCAIHAIRPLNCRKYPRAESEWLTEKTCGFRF